MRAVLNVSLPQELYIEIDNAITCHEYESKSQLVQTLVSQWASSRNQQIRQAEERQQKMLRLQKNIKHFSSLLTLGIQNVKSDFVEIGHFIASFVAKIFNKSIRLLAKGIRLIIFSLTILGRSTKICLISIGRDFRHTIISILSFTLHSIDKKSTIDNQVLYTRRSARPDPQLKLNL